MSRTLWLVLGCLLLGKSAFGQNNYNSPETGEKVLGSYFKTDIDNIDLQNGNLHLRIPLFSLPGREVPLSLNMDYNSRFVESRELYVGGQWVTYKDFYGWRKDAGIGGRFDVTRELASEGAYQTTINGETYQWRRYWNYTFTYIDSVGTKYRFPKTNVVQYALTSGSSTVTPTDNELQDNQTLESTTSEFIKMKTGNYFSGAGSPPQDMVIHFKNGVELRFQHSGAMSMKTVNGNTLSASNTNTVTTAYGESGSSLALGDYVPLSDTVGREISFSETSTQQTFTLKDSNGANQIYRVNFTDANQNRVSSIQLPNERYWTFEYDTSYEHLITKVTFPSGGYIRYTYSNHRVTSRNISADGTTEKTWSYQYGGPNGSGQTNTVVTDPEGAATTEYYDANGQNETTIGPLGTTIRTWCHAPTSQNLYLCQVVFTATDNKVRKTTYQADSYTNITRTDEYDWGSGSAGSLLRYTTRSYVTDNGYLDNRLLGLLVAETVFNPSNAVLAQTVREYDTLSLTARSGTIPGWTSPGSAPRGLALPIPRN